MEVDLNWAATYALNISGGLALYDAKLTEDYCSQTDANGMPVPDCYLPTRPYDRALAGSRLPLTARVKGNATARYTFDIADYSAYTSGLTINLATVDGPYRNIEGVIGGSGNDTLLGGAGSDTFVGGSGNDRLDLGSDANVDVIVFLMTSDSDSSTRRDQISRFFSGTDDIDIRAIDANYSTSGNATFKYTGTTATANSVWYSKSGSDVIVYGDVNGDRTADFQFQLTGIGSVLGSDFLL